MYFDDFKVKHTQTNVVQYNEYYPFGLQATTSWTRDSNKNNYLYNEGSELNSVSGWYETFYRGYDPTLGRFLQVDPLAHVTHSQTPYHYASNNPGLFNDPTGLLSDGEFAGIVQDLLNSEHGGTWTEAGGTHEFADESEASMWLAANEKKLREGGGGAYNGGVSLDLTGVEPGQYKSTIEGKDGRNYNVDLIVHSNGSVTILSIGLAGSPGIRFGVTLLSEAVVNGARDVSPEQFLEFITFYFRKEIGAVKRVTSLTWRIGGKLKDGAFGETTRLKDGSVHIKISQKALDNSKQLYLTIMHELVHAADLTNGNYDRWRKMVAMDNWTEDYVNHLMDNIMEYHAYSLDVQTAIDFGVDPSVAQSRLESAKIQIQDWGYLELFGQ
jgi:RHS repeat-associated protein